MTLWSPKTWSRRPEKERRRRFAMFGLALFNLALAWTLTIRGGEEPGLTGWGFILVELVGSSLGLFFSAGMLRYGTSRRAPSLSDRVETLTRILRTSAKAIDELEDEIRHRSELVDRLESEALEYERIVRLHRDEVEAVAQMLREELRGEGRRSFWLNTVVNLTLFSAGVLSGVWLR